MRYFEIVFASPDTTVEAYNRGADGYATCIRGIIKPSCQQAKYFLLEDLFVGDSKLPDDWICIDVQELTEQEAIPSYGYDKEDLDKRKMFTGWLFGVLDSMKTEW